VRLSDYRTNSKIGNCRVKEMRSAFEIRLATAHLGEYWRLDRVVRTNERDLTESLNSLKRGPVFYILLTSPLPSGQIRPIELGSLVESCRHVLGRLLRRRSDCNLVHAPFGSDLLS
jgi:hypothetical protein